jgi:hypothetical protein
VKLLRLIPNVYSSISVLVLALALAGRASAGPEVFTITDPSNGATATADLTFGSNTLTLVLTDTSVNPRDVGYNLSAFYFVLAGGTGGTLNSSTAPGLRTVASGGSFSDSALTSVGWVYSNASNKYTLDVLTGSGHLGPAHTIIGSPAAGDSKYDAANGSIAGNGPHNPFLADSATFIIKFMSGINANSLASQAWFQFGTTDQKFFQSSCQSGCTPIPEPNALLVCVSALVIVAGLLRRKLMT